MYKLHHFKVLVVTLFAAFSVSHQCVFRRSAGSLPWALEPRAAEGLPEAGASSLFPGRKTRHPQLVAVTNRGYYTLSNFSRNQASVNKRLMWNAGQDIYQGLWGQKETERSLWENKPLLIWSNNSKYKTMKTQSISLTFGCKHHFCCPAALPELSPSIQIRYKSVYVVNGADMLIDATAYSVVWFSATNSRTVSVCLLSNVMCWMMKTLCAENVNFSFV